MAGGFDGEFAAGTGSVCCKFSITISTQWSPEAPTMRPGEQGKVVEAAAWLDWGGCHGA